MGGDDSQKRPKSLSRFLSYALPVTSALIVPFPLARRSGPISLLRLPSRPSPRRSPTLFAAIPLARLPGMEVLVASFQQTAALPGR